MKKSILLILGVILCFFFSCTKDETQSSEKQILEFSIGSFGPNSSGVIDQVAKTITFEVPSGTDVTKLAPLIKVSSSATVVPAIGAEQDFTNPVSYTVTAEDGSVQVYVVKVIVLKSGEKSILSFKLGLTPEVTGKIDEVKKTVMLNVPIGTDVTGLTPTITFSKGAVVTPASGAKQDFTKPVKYTVTAEDGTKKEYAVTVEVAKSTEKKISEFKLAGITPQVAGVVNEEGKTISLLVPAGTDVTGLVPTITSSKGAVVTPATGVKQDFTKPVSYTVTAEDGSKQEYVVTVSVGKSSEKKISEFKLAGITPQVVGVISESDKTILLSLPAGTDVTALVPTITSSKGAVVTPATGVKQNFTKPVSYTVTAEDGTKQEYVVTASVGKSSEKKISEFRLAGITPQVVGVISESAKTILLSLPAGTNVTALVPTITFSKGAVVTPEAGVEQNFTSPVTYTVAAEDGTTVQYKVTAEVAIPGKSSKKAISVFKFAGLTTPVNGIINESNKTISAVVPFGTNIKALVPSITISEKAAVTPASDVAADFTHPLDYTVKAEDGTLQVYKVSVTVAPEVVVGKDSKINSFTFAGLTPAVVAKVNESAKTIYALVPFGTNVTTLIPTLTISANATVTPQSKVVTNFTAPVVYTVTAADGKTQSRYTVTVEVANDAPSDAPHITSIKNPESLIPGVSTIVIEGTNLEKEDKISYIKIGDVSIIASVNSDGTEISADLPATLAAGSAKVKVVIGRGETMVESNELDVVVKENTNPLPTITGISKKVLADGDEITITGTNFMDKDNTVRLRFTESPYYTFYLDAVRESSTSLTFKFDKSANTRAKAGAYTLYVTSNGRENTYSETITVNL
jgi:hypothetical protein